MKNIKVIPVIPSLNPDKKLINYVNGLIKVGFKKIIVLNDGSKKDCDKYFNELSKSENCIILNHKVNQGKGRALKTAINYYFDNGLDKEYLGIITADCDGQHIPNDTLKVAEKLNENNNSLILGTRDFNSKKVPFRSKFGNKITTIIFKLLYGKRINDTQTGLRAIPNEFLLDCLKLTGEKYDYEINMLIESVRKEVEIKEEIIETIYIDENKSSHFHPIKDSLKIYKVLFNQFFRFTFSGIFSFLLDILLFWLLVNYVFALLNPSLNIILSVIVSRIISSLVNFNLNQTIVFGCNDFKKIYFLKYYALCIVQMILSAILTTLLYKVLINETVAKIIIDSILFFISYNIQRKYIFGDKNV